jgi:hypothetical protein
LKLGPIPENTHIYTGDPSTLSAGILAVIHSWEDLIAVGLVGVDAGARAQVHLSMSEAFVDCLLHGYKQWIFENGDIAPLANIYRVWRKLEGKPKPNLDIRSRSHLKALEEFLYPIIQGGQMFITGSKTFGMIAGNCNPKVGDEIYVLVGGSTPYVLRPEGGDYRLMGPCYLTGRMQGETRAEVIRGERNIRSVTIA